MQRGLGKLARRLMAAALCLAMVFSMQTAPMAATDYKGQINDLNQQIANLKKEQEKLQNSIENTKDEKEKAKKQKENLQNQIYWAQQQVVLLSDRIGLLEENIVEKEAEIVERQEDIDKNYELFRNRLRAMYVNNTATKLGVVLGADTYSDFLVRSEVVSRISAYDKKLIDTLMEDKQAVEEALAEVKENKAMVEADRANMNEQKQTLTVKEAEVAKQEMVLDDLQRQYEAQKAQKQAEEKQAQAEINRIYAENASIGDYVGGDFLWPVSGYTTITSTFGWRFNNSDYHTGIDIAGRNAVGQAIYQKPIKAANAGKVIYASNAYAQGVGYGRYVIIDHGGGMSTLYGHQDSVAVSKGDMVEKGQVIGYVGTTGWSTGPHLHFEIRKDAQPTNPAGYFNIGG